MALEFSLLIDLGLIVIAATLFGYIARLLKQPSLLAYILAGLAIGPLGLGAMNLAFQGMPLGISNMQDIRVFSELGIAFLLFSVGVESDFRKLLSVGKTALLGAILQVAVTIAIGVLFTMLFPIMSFEESIYLGVILAFSSTMIVIKILGDAYEINTLHGRLLIGFLLIQDFLVIIAIPLLKDISLALSPGFLSEVVLKTVLLIAAAGVINRYLLPRLFKFSLRYQEEFYLAAVSSCFIFIGLALVMDIPIAVGAFIGGLALSTLPYNTEIFNKIRGLRDFFVTIFFVSLGMQLSFEFASIPVALIVFLVGMVIILKPLLYYLITIFSGFGNKISVLVALGLANVSEFSFIIAQQGYNPLDPGGSILSKGLFSLVVLIIAVSMVLTPYLMFGSKRIAKSTEKLSEKLPSKLRKKGFSRKLESFEQMPNQLTSHIVILGGGTMGSEIAKALYKSFPTVVIDQDSDVVYSCIQQGINALYGEADNIEILNRINIKDAKLVVLAIPNIDASLRALSFIKEANRETPVFARAHYYKDALKLYKAGVEFVCMPHVIGSNVFLKNIATFLDSGKLYKVINLEEEYLRYLKEKAEEEKMHFGL
ncbi:MAG: cation:proton antiporter [Candidatus Diapherotrites archaeon]|uniref:Cation:proton antiporter n=1 Tax=Candidatus Iainarchaeum sp. TaxID=3101447 RepID=A0A938YWM3_9ARCH|nr:cation:proton antiporter [Candidatus Diapherotrites archaeon]